MDKERLEWVMSGLNRYRLTEKEDQFIKSAAQNFNEGKMLTEQQEKKLENLYKEKSRFLPNRNYFSPRESNKTGEVKAKRPRPKFPPQ